MPTMRRLDRESRADVSFEAVCQVEMLKIEVQRARRLSVLI